MRRLRRTKVVATLGPASGNPSMISRLFTAGADVFRINMSHSSHDRMRELVAAIRSVETEQGRPIGILVDLQGPKLRVGGFAGGSVTLDHGAIFALDAETAAGDSTLRSMPGSTGSGFPLSSVRKTSPRPRRSRAGALR